MMVIDAADCSSSKRPTQSSAGASRHQLVDSISTGDSAACQVQQMAENAPDVQLMQSADGELGELVLSTDGELVDSLVTGEFITYHLNVPYHLIAYHLHVSASTFCVILFL